MRLSLSKSSYIFYKIDDIKENVYLVLDCDDFEVENWAYKKCKANIVLTIKIIKNYTPSELHFEAKYC